MPRDKPPLFLTKSDCSSLRRDKIARLKGKTDLKKEDLRI